MASHAPWRAFVAAAVTLALCVGVPASALARPGIQAEPIIGIAGFDTDCTILAADPIVAGSRALVEMIVNDAGVRTDAAFKWGKQPVPTHWITNFSTAEGYNYCFQPTQVTGRRFYDAVKRRIKTWNASLPQGYEPVTKVDVVGYSYGSTVARSCIANTGRGNPTNETPGCAALIDDWVAVVPPSHGTTTPWIIACPFNLPSICAATKPGGDFLLKLNERYGGDVPDQIGAGDETPQVPGTTPIEYTTLWAGKDGLINPPESAALWGAENYRLEAGSRTGPKPPGQLSHFNAISNRICPGSPDFGTSGVWERMAYQLLDVAPHQPVREESPRRYPTANPPSEILNCKQGPPGLTPRENAD